LSLIIFCGLKNNNIPVGPGRGSGAGSLVAWALSITELDPIKFGLIFERFLNPDRISIPDFDIDFCQEDRDKVINYVKNKYKGGSCANYHIWKTSSQNGNP
jgi:DNA polymerase III subunit alpha